MKVDKYLDMVRVAELIQDGYLRDQVSPNGDVILNYTAKTQYEKMWNKETLACRGLIYDRASNEILARPFQKFFNWGEVDRDMLPYGPIRVQEKADGSLGILYRDSVDHVLKIASRGSFTSEQALHASMLLQERYGDTFQPTDGVTYLFEIIYPENRIVLDYGDMDDLILLDVLDNETGQSLPHLFADWPGPVVEEHKFDSLVDVIEHEPDFASNREGFVVTYKDGTRVKVKFDDYVRLHKIITNCTAKSIWEVLAAGESVTSLLENVPDEFYDWVTKTVKEFVDEHNRIWMQSRKEFQILFARSQRDIPWQSEDRLKRKAFADTIRGSAYSKLLWLYYDGKPAEDYIWKLLKPEHSKPFWNKDD